MSKGSYRGGSTLTGWNANGYLSGAGRGLSRKAGLKALTARTAQSISESAETDDEARARHGLRPRKPIPKPASKVETPTPAERNAAQRKRSRTSAPVVVVRIERKTKDKVAPKPKRQISQPPRRRT